MDGLRTKDQKFDGEKFDCEMLDYWNFFIVTSLQPIDLLFFIWLIQQYNFLKALKSRHQSLTEDIWNTKKIEVALSIKSWWY